MPLDFDVAAYLGELLGAGIAGLEPLSGGDWSHAFGFQSEGRQLVARFGGYRDDFEKDRAGALYSSQQLQVPKVVRLEEAPGGFCCVSERRFGTYIEDSGADQMHSLVPAVLQLWDALRLADISIWIAQVGKPKMNWTDQLLAVDLENDRVHGWHDRLVAGPFELAIYNRQFRELRHLARDCPQDLHLQHNDLLHANVLVQGAQITAVFDWGCAGLGDFLYDLAIFDFYRPWFPAMTEIDWAAEAKRHYEKLGLDVPGFDHRLDCYKTHVGLAGMAYCAFIDDRLELKRHAERLQT